MYSYFKQISTLRNKIESYYDLPNNDINNYKVFNNLINRLGEKYFYYNMNKFY